MDTAASLKADHGRPSLLSTPGTPSSSFGQGSPLPNQPGYTTPRFAAKQEQQLQVEKHIRQTGFIPSELVKGEVEYFYNQVGVDDTYFSQENVPTIAGHITSLYGSKVLAYSRNKDTLDIRLEKIEDDSGLFIHTSEPGVEEREYEQLIDKLFLNGSKPEGKPFRLESYRSSGNVSSSLSQRLRCYFVTKCNFINANPTEEQMSDIRAVSDRRFLERASENTLSIYSEVMQHALQRSGPVVEAFQVENSREHRLVIGFKQGTTTNFFSALSKLYHWYGVYSSRKYVEQFSNGITLICCYLNPLRGPPIENSIVQIVREASLIYCLPNNPFFATQNNHAAQEAAYAYCGWIFCQHFLNRLGQSYLALKNLLNDSDPVHQTVLSDIRQRFRQETFTRQSIKEAISTYPDLLRSLYVQFAMVHYVSGASELVPTLSYQRLNREDILSDEELYNKIKRTISDKLHFRVFESLMIFNKAVLKTNFYQPTKVALSFRLSGNFLPPSEFPSHPYGIFLVVGSDFRGFHVRFKDVARGGIRLIRSRNSEAFSINQRNLFDENYSLASTQASKNKDIPEGGAKGTILPDLDAQPRTCFEKYIDSLLDLMLKGNTPGIKEDIVDMHKKPEILFLGPDEGTADMMDWAALHARHRGASFWKSFTTGKSPSLGGIAHDTYGMTSLGVRQYSIGIFRQLALKEEEVTKVQTGGPDGDLGSNEILLSKDKTVAIIDGSGVIHDPHGLDRSELQRLAKTRKMISEFDASKLSVEGYRVLVEDHDFKLPSGEIIPDGTTFRNKAHLRFKADLFVPCGGRPESINVSNVNTLFDGEGKPNFRFIVEGANLFITQQARLILEQRGCVLFKDASANKGGVTSSSLEVLSGLTLDDEEFIDLMTTSDEEGVSDFYADYVREIQRIICQNATAEFNCLWKASQETGKPRAALTDEVGRTLVKLQDELENSDLYENDIARNTVLSRAIPKPLLDRLGLETILQRLPESYSRSLFASWIAAHYLYKYGLNASAVDFYHFFSHFGLPAAKGQ